MQKALRASSRIHLDITSNQCKYNSTACAICKYLGVTRQQFFKWC